MALSSWIPPVKWDSWFQSIIHDAWHSIWSPVPQSSGLFRWAFGPYSSHYVSFSYLWCDINDQLKMPLIYELIMGILVEKSKCNFRTYCQICGDSQADLHRACSMDVRCKVGLCITTRILMHILWRMGFINQSLHQRYQWSMGQQRQPQLRRPRFSLLSHHRVIQWRDKPLSFSKLFQFLTPTDFN